MKRTITLDSMTFVGVDNMPFDVNYRSYGGIKWRKIL